MTKVKITNTHKKKETYPLVLNEPKRNLPTVQKSTRDLKFGESILVSPEQVGQEVEILKRKGHAKVEQVEVEVPKVEAPPPAKVTDEELEKELLGDQENPDEEIEPDSFPQGG